MKQQLHDISSLHAASDSVGFGGPWLRSGTVYVAVKRVTVQLVMDFVHPLR